MKKNLYNDKKMSADGGGGGGGHRNLPGSDPRTGVVKGTLERIFTRSYLESLKSLILLTQQSDDNFCTLFALNNIIKLSPFVKDKSLVSVENFVLGCDRFLKTKAEDRKECTMEGFFYLRPSNFALEAHYEDLGKPQEVFMVEVPLDNPENPPGFFPAAGSSILYQKPFPVSELTKLPVGMIIVPEVRIWEDNKEKRVPHSIAVIPLYPAISSSPEYNSYFIVVDSAIQSISVHENQQKLYEYLFEQYKLIENSFLFYVNISSLTAKMLYEHYQEISTPLENVLEGGKTLFLL